MVLPYDRQPCMSEEQKGDWNAILILRQKSNGPTCGTKMVTALLDHVLGKLLLTDTSVLFVHFLCYTARMLLPSFLPTQRWRAEDIGVNFLVRFQNDLHTGIHPRYRYQDISNWSDKKHSKLKLREYMTFFCSRDRIPPADSSDLLHCKQSRKERSAHLLFVYMKCECEQIGYTWSFRSRTARPILLHLFKNRFKIFLLPTVSLSRYSWGRNIGNYTS